MVDNCIVSSDWPFQSMSMKIALEIFMAVDLTSNFLICIYLVNGWKPLFVNYFKIYIRTHGSLFKMVWGTSSWLWSYGSWIDNDLCNQCLSPLMLWVHSGELYSIQHHLIFFWALKFPPRIITDRHDIAEILLKVA